MCTNKRKRRLIALKLITVFVVLLSMLSCTLSVSAAEYEYTYTTYTYSDFGSDAIVNFDLDGGYQVEGEWKYDRVSGSFPNHFVYEFQNDVAPVGRPIVFYIAAFIDDTYAPGSYTMEFDISVRTIGFKGWDQIPMTSAEYPDPYNPMWVDVDNPALTFGPTYVNNNGAISWNANVFSTFGVSSESANTPSAGFKNYKFFTSFTIDKARQFDDIIIRIPYDFTGNAQDWGSGSMSMFMSDIVVKSYTDNPAAVDKYEPPDGSAVDDYAAADKEVSDFAANSGADEFFNPDNLTAGIGEDSLDSTFAISELLQYIHDKLPFVTNIVYISVSFGIVMLLFNLVPALVGRK